MSDDQGSPVQSRSRLLPDVEAKLLAAASSAADATNGLIETIRYGEPRPGHPSFCDDATVMLADALRLTIEAAGDPSREALLDELRRFLLLDNEPGEIV